MQKRIKIYIGTLKHRRSNLHIAVIWKRASEDSQHSQVAIPIHESGVCCRSLLNPRVAGPVASTSLEMMMLVMRLNVARKC